MKRLVALVVLALALAACGGQTGTTPATPETQPTEEPTMEPTLEPTAEPTATPLPAEPLPTDASPLDGVWEGAIDVGGQALDIVVEFSAQTGALMGTIDIPAQGAENLPLDNVTLDGDQVHFEIATVQAVFDGTLADGTISGDFTQGPATGTFTLERTGDVGEAPAAGETPLPVDASPLDGRWDGAIDVGGQALDIVVQFNTATGALMGTIDIPAQGAAGLPLTNISLDGDQVHFEIAGVGAAFDGTLADGTLSGDFTQGPATGTFTLERSGEAIIPTATPVPPYVVDEVTWPLDDTTVSATYTQPEGDGPFPAVVFVAGSGPTDRNWNSPLLAGTNGSAALLADALTRDGYATLRYDKRFTGPYAEANLAALAGNVSFQSHLDELRSAVEYAAAQPDVDPDRIYVLANSEGTLHALNYQTSDPTIPFAGMILTGAPGRPLADVLRQQIGENVLGDVENRDELLALWDEAIAAFLAGEPAQLDAALPEAAQQTFAGLVAPINQPFSAELLAADPAAWLAQTEAPVLVIIGQKDIQVDYEADGAVLEAAAGDNVTFAYPADANHVLKYEPKPVDELTAADGALYNAPDRVLDPEALQTILDWLAARQG